MRATMVDDNAWKSRQGIAKRKNPHRKGLPVVWYIGGSPGRSLLMYIAHCTCDKGRKKGWQLNHHFVNKVCPAVTNASSSSEE
jgi:hypothetical protein